MGNILFSISHATKSRKTTKDEERLIELIDSKTISICHNIKDPNNSFSLQTKHSFPPDSTTHTSP